MIPLSVIYKDMYFFEELEIRDTVREYLWMETAPIGIQV